MSAAKIVKAFSLKDGQFHRYLVPAKSDALRHSQETWGSQYDRHERKVVEGGVALLWERLPDSAS